MGQTNKGKRIRKRSRARRLPPAEGMGIAELAAQAAVTPRTVRYYVHRGVLPPPEFHGTRTRYRPDHLARLRAIAAMQKEGIDLAAIGRRLATMSNAEVEAYLTPPPSPAPGALTPSSSPAMNASGRWDHVPLLPGIELHVRSDASPAVRRVAQELIDHCIGAGALELVDRK